MIRIFGASIRNKVTAAILLTALVSLAVSFAVLVVFEWRTAEQELVERMRTAGRIVRENVTAAVAFQAVEEAEKMMSALETDREFVAAALYDDGGERLAGYVRPSSRYTLPAVVPEEGVIERREEVVLVLPIVSGDEQIGSLLLAAHYETRNQRFALYLATAGGMFCLSIGIAIFLSRVLEERVSKPILSLVETTRRVTSNRDYSIRVTESDTAEVGLLAESFNQMLKEVNHREVQLTQAMDRLRLTLDASKTYTWEWDRSTNQIHWQSAEQMPEGLARLQGLTPGELLLRVHPRDHKRLTEAYEAAISEGDDFSFEFSLNEEGETLGMACRGKGFRSKEGRLIRAVGVMTDITQRRLTEQALYWREQEFRALVEHSPDIIARYDRDLRVSYVNPAGLRYTGRALEEIQGRTLEEMGVPDHRVTLWRIAIERIYNGASHSELEFAYRHPDGSERYFLARLVPEFAPDGQVEHVLAVSREITERKQYERELQAAKERAEAAAQAKSVFLSNMSHDIRTPLTTILGCAELLKRKGDEESREMIAMIKAGGKRLMDTLNSVLDLARLEGGEAELRFESVNVTAELEELIGLFRLRAEEKSLKLVVHAPEQAIFGRLDKPAFTRVVMNILGNALKFTAKGSITVRLWRQDPRFYLSVEDTGPGIPQDTLAKIFDAFTRSRQSEVRQVEGSGLGMTITRQLVRLMGGEILVESVVGRGSVFTLALDCAEAPLEARKAPAAKDAEEAESGSRLSSILAVEDNPHTVRLLELLLAGKYDATVVSAGSEALALARRRSFDAVLMDLSLETSEAGIDYMKQLRVIDGYGAVPIIAFTAHALPGEAERYRRLGFDDYLGKPFTSDALDMVLGRCLRRAAAQE